MRPTIRMRMAILAVLLTLAMVEGCDLVWSSYVDRSASGCTKEMADCLANPLKCPANAESMQDAIRFCGTISRIGQISVNTRAKQDVDILFVIDNSPSMSPKQKQLASAIDSFIQKIDQSGSNYHLGVTSTDIGAQQAPNTAFQPGNLNISGCDSYKGNDGELQKQACSARDQSKWSQAAKDACNLTLCKTKLEPTNGDVYLWKQDGQTNAPSNDIIGTFKCIAPIGDAGCGLESPLEAAKRALDSHSTINQGFLHQNSVLAVIFVTDEDDCSVQLTTRAQSNPNSIDCTKNGMSTYNCWKNDFRCLAYNLTCDQPLTTTGAKTNCKEDGNGYLESVDKYVTFLSTLRTSNKLVLAGIWTPTMLDNPNSDTTKDGKLIVDYDPAVCTPGPGVTCSTEALNRGQGSKAACLNATDNNFFGQAQIRLSSFIRKFDASSRVEQSICDPNNYVTVLNTVADRITSRASTNCLTGQPKTDQNGSPICIVGLVDANTPAALPDVRLPQCSSTCCKAWATAGDPNNVDVAGRTAKPVPNDPYIVGKCTADPDCYCAVANPTSNYGCKDAVGNDSAIVGLWIKSDPHFTPSGKVANVICTVR